MSATGSSSYEILVLESNDQQRTVDLTLGAISIDYYEDIFSPTITAKVRVINTGDSITGKNDKLQSIYNGLPLRGGERLRMKILDNGNSGDKPGLDFSKNTEDYLYVSSITDVISDSRKESFLLNLVSREAITNETTRVTKKYSTAISDSVEKILKEVLKTKKKIDTDKSKNPYSFIGNQRKPFTTLIWLASRSVPATASGNKDATAGFFFYQTKDGFKFKSIDGLMNQKPKAKYFYSEVNVNEQEVDTDFKILNYSIDKNQNLIEKLRLGTYSSQRIFFNPYDGGITSPGKQVFKLSDYQKNIESLGSDSLSLPKMSDNSSDSLGDAPTRIFTKILNVGTINAGIGTNTDSDPEKYQSQSLMRYNLLLTQSVSMMIPCNTNLNAGDVIECEFPKISSQDSDEIDTDVSGPYIIKELCHHFEPNKSYTSLKLVRDNFGIKKKKD